MTSNRLALLLTLMGCALSWAWELPQGVDPGAVRGPGAPDWLRLAAEPAGTGLLPQESLLASTRGPMPGDRSVKQATKAVPRQGMEDSSASAKQEFSPCTTLFVDQRFVDAEFKLIELTGFDGFDCSVFDSQQRVTLSISQPKLVKSTRQNIGNKSCQMIEQCDVHLFDGNNECYYTLNIPEKGLFDGRGVFVTLANINCHSRAANLDLTREENEQRCYACLELLNELLLGCRYRYDGKVLTLATASGQACFVRR